MSKQADQVDNVVLLHGYAESPTKVWFPWLHEIVESRGVRVWAPVLPDPLKPDLEQWLKTVAKEAAGWSDRTVIVAHSLGGVLALRALEILVKRPVRAVITVGTPFAATMSVQTLIDFFGGPVDWSKVRRRAGKFVTIQSKNDPLVPYDHAFRYHEMLGSKVVLTEKDGHFIGKTGPVIAKELARLLGKK